MSSNRTHRATATITAAFLLLTGAAVASAAPAGAAAGFALERLQGQDRYATAAAIARDGFAGTDVALLANGQSDDPRTSRNESHFPDALAGSYLSGLKAAPTLLTTETALPRPTAEALRELGVRTVVIVGGPSAVSARQEQQLRAAGYLVERIAGSNRYATAATVARTSGSTGIGTVGGRRTAIVASGTDFPDALVMGPLAFAGRLPLTITDPTRLSPETRAVLTDLRVEQVLVAGGTSAVGASVESEIEALGITVRRFAGSVRTETARLVAEFAVDEMAFSDRHVDLALGLRFPDALAGGPHAGAQRAPILLTAGVDTLGTSARTYLEDHAVTLQDGHVLGGTSAVSIGVESDAEQAGEGDGSVSPSPTPTASPTSSPTASPTSSPTSSPTASPTASPTESPAPVPAEPPAPAPSDTGLQCSTEPAPANIASNSSNATDAPELESVEYAGAPTANTAGTATTADDFCQVQVKFTFDEPVVGPQPVATRFLLVGFDPALRFVGRSADRNASGEVVTVTFGRADDPATATDERESLPQQLLTAVSLAAVEADAVTDGSGTKNPIGDAGLGDERTVHTVGGWTRGPDLLSVSPLSADSFGFEFDEPVVVAKAGGFHLITAANRDIACTGPVASGSRVTATCVVPPDGASRGVVDSRSVTATGSSELPMPNVLQTAPVVGTGTQGRTDGPDLVKVEKRGDKSVAYVFDEEVFLYDPKKFLAYKEDTVELQSNDATRPDAKTVVATFLTDVGHDVDFPRFAGASVLDGAVVRPGTTNFNQEDEAALADVEAVIAATTGSTLGPDLVKVLITPGATDTDMPTARFDFDEPVVPSVVLSSLSLYYTESVNQLKPEDPRKTHRLTCAVGSRTGAFSVTCTGFRTGTASVTRDATVAEVRGARLGTADDGAVRDSAATPNPEGAEVTTTGS